MEATKDMMIAKVIELDEGTAEILMNAGMHCLGCAMAHGETIEQACAVHGIDCDALVQQINAYLAKK
jgi:hybrid cluster-associated redox disulfide protein